MIFDATKKKVFRTGTDSGGHYHSQYSQMCHFAASDDYKPNVLLETCNKRAHILRNKAYADNALIAIIDKSKETLLLLSKVYSYSNIGDTFSWTLERAFDHYTIITVPCFKVKETEQQLKLDYARCCRNLNRSAWEAWRDIENDLKGYEQLCTYKNVKPDAELVESVKALLQKRAECNSQRHERERAEEEARAQRRHESQINGFERVKKLLDSKNIVFAENATASQKARALLDVVFQHSDFSAFSINAEDRRLFFKYSYGPKDGYVLDMRNESVMHYIGGRTVGGRCCDYVWYDVEKDAFVTSQGCTAEVKGVCNRILDNIIEAADTQDHMKMIQNMDRAVGPYRTREYDWSSNILRVGCHVFSLEDLKGLQAEYYGSSDKRTVCVTKMYTTKIEENRKQIDKLQMEIAKFSAKLKLLTNQE